MGLPLFDAIGGILKQKGRKKAGKEDLRARTEEFGQGERSRIWRNQASQALLRSLFGGRYAIPEDTFANFQEERPYTGVDPTIGQDWQFYGGGVQGAGDVILDTAAAAATGGASAAIPGGVSGLTSGISSYPDAPSVSPTGEVSGVDFGDPSKNPNLPR